MKIPRMTKTHAALRAQRLVELGWTVKHEFKADNETYEWYLDGSTLKSLHRCAHTIIGIPQGNCRPSDR